MSAFGEEMSQLDNFLRDECLTPKEGKMILFVQFKGLLQKTAQALTSYSVRYARVRGNARQRSPTLDEYQRGMSPRLLLLDVANNSVSGSNLIVANHVIFLSSLVANDQATDWSTLQ